MRGITFVLVPTLSLVNMGVNGASIGNILAQRGEGAKLGGRQYHTADFSNSDPAAHKGDVAHRAVLDALTQSAVLSSTDPGSSTATNGTPVQSVSPRVDVAQNEIIAASEDVQNIATVLPRELSLGAPSLTNTLAPNTISSGDGLTSLSGVDSLRRAEMADNNTAVCSKHKESMDARALEITKTSATDPIDISNVDGGLALRAQHARGAPAPIAGLPVVGPIIGAAVPRSVNARDLELLGILAGTEMFDSVIDNAVRDLTVTPTFNHKPILGEADLGPDTLPTASGIHTVGAEPISSLGGLGSHDVTFEPVDTANPDAGLPNIGFTNPSLIPSPAVPVVVSSGSSSSPAAGGFGIPVVGSDALPISGGPKVPVVGGSGGNSLPGVGESGFPVVGSNTGGSALPIPGEVPVVSIVGGSVVPVLGSITARPIPGPTHVPVVGSSGSNTLPFVGGSRVPVIGSITALPVPGASSVPDVGGLDSGSLPFVSGSVLPIIGSSTALPTPGESSVPIVGSLGSSSLPLVPGVPIVGSNTGSTGSTGSNVLSMLGQSKVPLVGSLSSSSGSSALPSPGKVPIVGDSTSSSLPILGVPTNTVGSSTGIIGSFAPLGIPIPFGAIRRQVDTDTAEGDVEAAKDVADEIMENTARGFVNSLNSRHLLGSRTVKRDASITLNALHPSLTALFNRQEDIVGVSDDSADGTTDSGDTTSTADASDSTDEAIGSTDAATVARRQTSDSTDSTVDSANGADSSSDLTDSGDDSDSADVTASAARRQTTDDSSTDAAGDSTDSADSGDSADSSDAGGASDSLDTATVSVTRRQTTDESADVSNSTTEDATGSADSGDASDSSDVDASTSVTRRQTAPESVNPSDSSDASGDSADAADSGDVSGSDSSDATTVAAARRQTTDDSTDASNSGDAAGDSTTDSADGSGSFDTSGDSSDASGSTDAAVKRRQDAIDDGSSTSGDASTGDGDDTSSATSAGGSEEAVTRRRALGLQFTPPKNRMIMRKVRRQDNIDIDDTDVDASSEATDVSATVDSLDNLD
ncbi:hypothetical protein D9619_001452 [Psilocybe cf. subviscida]|uniref:Uncharacterized protein n=1 Tax=Psilocybe cf. subviscida TaxID=2480587 RepID=A0A8H5F3M8_9AGAR|nr:hypothetical protein D9619_001452 [Psilocybe cf. subviscida]